MLSAQQVGCSEAAAASFDQGSLLDSYLPLVRAAAYRIFQTIPARALIEFDDLVQAGIIGLLDAGRSFRPETNVPFRMYARYRVRGAMLDALRGVDAGTRNLRRRMRMVAQAIHELGSILQRTPSDEDLCVHLSMELPELHELRREMADCAALSNPENESGSEDPWSRRSGDVRMCPERMFRHKHSKRVLENAMESLPERHREVILDSFEAGNTMKDIADALGITPARVWQIRKVALDRMAGSLRKRGVSSSADL